MRFRQYIPVKAAEGGSNPDPAIYCPANGYIPDPAIYQEDPVITNTPRPGTNQIRLLVTDSGSCHVQFKCGVSNAGKYVVTVTGKDNVVINQLTFTNNVICSVFVPFMEGFLAPNYTYFFIDIAPELVGNDIVSFNALLNSTYDANGGFIIAAYFNTPQLTTLYQAFSNNKRVTYIEFIPTLSVLTNLHQVCIGCSELKKVVFQGGLPALTTMQQSFSGSGLLEIVLPNDLPSLLTMVNTFNGTPMKAFTFPANLPLLSDLSYTFYTSQIETITFTSALLPEVTTLAYFCYQCKKLKGKITYPEMPKVTTLYRTHYENDNIAEIQFQGDMPLLNSFLELAVKCIKLKKITFPEVAAGFTTYNINIVLDDCSELEEVVLPKTLHVPEATLSTHKFFNDFKGCYKLHTISTIESTIYGNMMGTIAGTYLRSLKRFDQPNAFFNKNALFFEPPSGVQGQLEYFDCDWNQAPKNLLGFRNQNMPVAEVKRILSKIVNHVNETALHYFYLSGNPEWDAIDYNWNPTGLTSLGRTMSFTIAAWDPRVAVGTQLFNIQGNGSNTKIIVQENNFFSLNSSFRIAPYNGVKFITYSDTFAAYGLVPFKTFYVVNSDIDSGVNFQLSETEGGAPYPFTFGASEVGLESGFAYFSNYVAAISFNGSIYYGTMAFPNYYNSGSRYGVALDHNYFDMWDMLIKGYRPE